METMQVTIVLDGRETALLRKRAMQELRKPRDQARYLLRQALGLADGHTAQETADRGAKDLEPQRAAA